MTEPSKGSPPGAGKSSFELIDSARLFRYLRLKKGVVFLDMGCGRGLYAFAAAERIGEEGLLYAIDLWEEGITLLRNQAAEKGIHNIQAMVGDISKPTPLENRSVDFCLLATVFHDLVLVNTAEGALQEITRVLKPQGVLAIVEFKKIEGPPGPPRSSRLAAEEVEERVVLFGFHKKRFADLGPYAYLLLFSSSHHGQ